MPRHHEFHNGVDSGEANSVHPNVSVHKHGSSFLIPGNIYLDGVPVNG